MLKLILFFLYPAFEIYLLIKAGSLVGGISIVAWIFASAGLGFWIIKKYGKNCLVQAQQELKKGNIPQQAIIDGPLIFLSGVLLILPGLLSDTLGLLLLVPIFRQLFAVLVISCIHTKLQNGKFKKIFQFIYVNNNGTETTSNSSYYSEPKPNAKDLIIDTNAIIIENKNSEEELSKPQDLPKP